MIEHAYGRMGVLPPPTMPRPQPSPRHRVWGSRLRCARSLFATSSLTKLATVRQGKAHPILANLVTSGTAVGLATACTQPMDVLKVRMQLEALVKGHQAVGMVRSIRVD